MQSLDTIHDYLRSHSDEIGERILSSYPALHGGDEAPSPLLSRMVRVPYPAQVLAIMGVSKRGDLARNANVVAGCGAEQDPHRAGKYVGAQRRKTVFGFGHDSTAPGREVGARILPEVAHVRVFLSDDMRNGGNPREPHGVNEVVCAGVRLCAGMHTSLSELRRLGRKGWRRLYPETTIFCIGREKAKLSYFWKHCYGRSRLVYSERPITTRDLDRMVQAARWPLPAEPEERKPNPIPAGCGLTSCLVTRYKSS